MLLKEMVDGAIERSLYAMTLEVGRRGAGLSCKSSIHCCCKQKKLSRRAASQAPQTNAVYRKGTPY